MLSKSHVVERPFAVSLIAFFQGALTAYCLFFAAAAFFDPPANLGYLRSALRLLVGQTGYCSYAGQSRDEYGIDLFFLSFFALGIAVYSGRTGWGLWQLKKWARHSVAGKYGAMLALWARGFLWVGIGGDLAHTPASVLHPIYWVIFVEAAICLTLLFHGGVAEAFGEEE